MALYVYRCRVCDELVEVFRPVAHRDDPLLHCGRVCDRDIPAQFRAHNANCGEIVSVNAGVAPKQIKEAEQLFGDLGIKFSPRGDAIAPTRQAYLKYLGRRGLVNSDEICGGH